MVDIFKGSHSFSFEIFLQVSPVHILELSLHELLWNLTKFLNQFLFFTLYFYFFQFRLWLRLSDNHLRLRMNDSHLRLSFMFLFRLSFRYFLWFHLRMTDIEGRLVLLFMGCLNKRYL